MENPRFFCRPIIASQALLSGTEAHHLVSVLRCRVGDRVELFDGNGTLAQATITHIKSANVTLTIDAQEPCPPPPQPAIIIAVSLAKGDRFDWLVGKCAEVGVDRICPVIYDRTVKLAQGKNTQERWQHLAVSAAKQCRRLYLPQIDPPLPLAQVCTHLKKHHPDSQTFVGSLWPQAPSLLAESLTKDTTIFIGPEGGFTATEEAFFSQQAIRPIRLTDTIMRIETAALAAAIILAVKRTASPPQKT